MVFNSFGHKRIMGFGEEKEKRVKRVMEHDPESAFVNKEWIGVDKGRESEIKTIGRQLCFKTTRLGGKKS